MYKFFLLFVLSLLCRYEIGCLMLSDFAIEMITFLVAVSRCLYCPTRCCIDFVMKKAFCSEKLPPNASEARSLGQSSLKPKVGKEASLLLGLGSAALGRHFPYPSLQSRHC